MLNLIVFTVFCSALLLSAAAAYHFLLRKSVLTLRMESFHAQEKISKAPREVESGTWACKLRRIGERVKLPEKERSKYVRKLVAAGLRRESLYHFLGAKVLLACVLPLMYILLFAAPQRTYFTTEVLLAALACGIAGYLMPTYWLHAKVKSRQLRIFHTLPDILDMVTLCVEAGLSIDAALIRTTETPQFDDNPLACEIKQVTMETRAGKPRIESLKDMAERTMVEDLSSFTTMLAQTERFGTSLGQALGSFSQELRTKRRQLAEEAAAKTTIKMIFPLILFIFPALLVVILGPALIQIGKIFQ